MGIGFNQFDFIDNRFIAHQIKALDVICKEQVQVTDTTTLAETACGTVVDPATGELQEGVFVDIVNIDAAVGIIPNKVVNTFVVTLQLRQRDPQTGAITELGSPFDVTINDGIECRGAGTGPGETVVQKHDIQASPSITVTGTAATGFFLHFTVAIHYCLIVAKETILKVRGAEKFC